MRYVWDMCGVRYANNLLKNPATKRLSGKKKTIGWDIMDSSRGGSKCNSLPTPTPSWENLG